MRGIFENSSTLLSNMNKNVLLVQQMDLIFRSKGNQNWVFHDKVKGKQGKTVF